MEEPEPLEQQVDSSPADVAGVPPRWSKALLVLTTVLAILAIVTVWARVQLLDTDEWVDQSSQLLDDPAVQEALSRTIVDGLYEDGSIRAALEERLPEDFQGIAPFIAGSLRDPLTSAVERLLDSPAVQQRWETVNRRAHETFVNVLRDETRSGVSTADGTVVVELRPLLIDAGESLGLSTDRLDQIPEDAGRIVLFESSVLEQAQTMVRVVDVVAWFLFVLVVGAYAALVFTAIDRRSMLRNVGVSLVLVGVVVLLVQAIGRRLLLDAIVERPENRPAGSAIIAVSTGLVRQMGWSAVAYGVLIAAFAALIGPHRWAVGIRRTVAPAFQASSGAIAAGTFVLILLLWWWSPGRTFSGWTTGLVLVGLVIAAVIAVRHRILAETPTE